MKKLLVALTLCFSCCLAFSQFNWVQKASLPSDGRESSGCFTIGNQLYVICGRTSVSPYVHVSELWEYNSLTDNWVQKADYPGGARTAPLAFAVGGKGYVVTGISHHV
jgi:N-acetylneuraminic acid mutarotase